MRLFDYENKRVITESDQVKANELIDAGKAVKLDMTELDEFEKKASDIYDNYQKEVDRIKNNDNPIFTDKVKAYELNRLKEEYEKQSAEVEQSYHEYRSTQQEEARKRAVQATVKVTDADKLTAQQFATRAMLSIASASNTSVALKQIADDIALLTDEQRTALQSEIVGVLAGVDNDYHKDKQAIISAVQDIRNSDLLAFEVAKQLPHSVLTKQRVHDIAKRVASESMHTTGGMSREFYDKHIRGDGK